MRRLLPSIVPLVAVLALDQLSKWWALETLWTPPRELKPLPGWLHMTPVENRGVAFGLFTEHGGLLALLVLALLGVLAIRNRRELLAAHPSIKVTAGLIIGGGIGNLIDRFRIGFVVDFITLPKLPIFQVFNIADLAITFGGVLLMLAALLADRREKALAREQGTGHRAQEGDERTGDGAQEGDERTGDERRERDADVGAREQERDEVVGDRL